MVLDQYVASAWKSPCSCRSRRIGSPLRITDGGALPSVMHGRDRLTTGLSKTSPGAHNNRITAAGCRRGWLPAAGAIAYAV
ncbi:hypothetical protein XaplCFBP3123_16180 [Xanthomonas arboricola pv. populi]|nr:hypothetical protein XaplCFBP3123_16180 [Xanthomonas arboricola pv. populi]